MRPQFLIARTQGPVPVRPSGHAKRGDSVCRHSMCGYSLLELLVAILIVSFGILGVAKLQAVSKQANFEVGERMTATNLAQDLLERMRANPGALAAYTQDGAGRTITAASDVPTSGTGCGTTACTAEQHEAYEAAYKDLQQWWLQVAGAAETIGGGNVGGLSAPTACVSGPAGGDGTYTVTLAWRALSRLGEPVSSACGQGDARYEAASGASLRRVLVLQGYIDG